MAYLTTVDSFVAFASLEVASPLIPLPDLLASQFAAAAQRYPKEAAGLTLFDIFHWQLGSGRKPKSRYTHGKRFALPRF